MMQFSFTQLMSYVRCPQHYLFRYILGIKKPPLKLQKRGFAFHEAIAFHFDQKKQDNKGLNLPDLKEFFATTFKSAIEDYEEELEASKFLVTKEYIEKEKEIDIAQLLDEGILGIELFYKELNPIIYPDLIETDFIFPVSQRLELIGRIDLADKKDVIHEFKTTRRIPRLQDIANDPQLAIYQIGYKVLQGKEPISLHKEYLIFSKKEPKIVKFELEKPALEEQVLLQDLQNVVKAIEQNIFYCFHPADSWICSKEWCGYYALHQELRKLGFEAFISRYSR